MPNVRGMTDTARDYETYTHFLTLTDVAEILNAELDDVRLLVESGELPALRLGSLGSWRVDTAMLEIFIAHEYEQARRSALWSHSQLASAHNVLEF